MNKSLLKSITDFGPLLVFLFFYYNGDKDLKIAINQANNNGVSLETVRSILDEYIVLSEKGGGNQDTSSLIKTLETN